VRPAARRVLVPCDVDLRDVYRAKQGRISIDIETGGTALAGSYFAALPVLRRLQRERKQEAAAPETGTGDPFQIQGHGNGRR
jgi:hypothetical protein